MSQHSVSCKANKIAKFGIKFGRESILICVCNFLITHEKIGTLADHHEELFKVQVGVSYKIMIIVLRNQLSQFSVIGGGSLMQSGKSNWSGGSKII